MTSKKEERFDISSLKSAGSGVASIITDKKANVQYLLVISPNMGSGMTVLVDRDGKPLLKED